MWLYGNAFDCTETRPSPLHHSFVHQVHRLHCLRAEFTGEYITLNKSIPRLQSIEQVWSERIELNSGGTRSFSKKGKREKLRDVVQKDPDSPIVPFPDFSTARVPLGASTPFESDGYPTPYANDEFIIFYGEAEEGLSVVFEFIDFDLEEDRDFLTFGCGDNPYDQSTVVESLTGGLPPTLTIDCDRIWFTFRSDSSQGDNRGFLGIVTTVEREGKILFWLVFAFLFLAFLFLVRSYFQV